MDTKISVIIPVYNTSSLLRRCLDSVVNQTYKNLEIILINDGSTDNSLEICKEYALKDKRIVIIDKANEGGGKARNAGLDIATGDYIAFVDSDDEVDVRIFELLYSYLQKNNAEMAICDYATKHLDNDYQNIKEEVLDNHDLMKELFIDKKVSSHLWRKLYPKKCFINNRFSDRKVVHDMSIDHHLLKEVNKAVLIDAKLYFYTQVNPDNLSNTNKWKVDSSFLRGQVIAERIEFAREYYPDLVYYLLPQVTEFFLGSYARINISKQKDNDRQEYIRNYFRKESSILKTDNVSFPQKVVVYSIAHNIKPLVWLACRYYKWQTKNLSESIPNRY